MGDVCLVDFSVGVSVCFLRKTRKKEHGHQRINGQQQLIVNSSKNMIIKTSIDSTFRPVHKSKEIKAIFLLYANQALDDICRLTSTRVAFRLMYDFWFHVRKYATTTMGKGCVRASIRCDHNNNHKFCDF